MPAIHDLPLFIVSALLLNLTPGADSLFVVTRAASTGFRAGAVAALGIGAGCLGHVLIAASGLSALLAASSTAFAVLRVIGAGYLVFLGLSLLRARDPVFEAPASPVEAALPRVFRQGVLTNLLNPKVAMFFLAFLPQFVDAGAPSRSAAFVLLGAIFTATGTAWCLALAWSAARLGRAGVGRRVAAWLRRAAGVVFTLLGVRLALPDSG